MTEKQYTTGRLIDWVVVVFGMAFVATAFYSLGQKVDAIEVEPIVRFASNDVELEERLKLYEELLIGLLVCEDVQ